MNAKEERAAKKRLKGRVWQADGYPKPHLRGTSTTDYRVEELGNPPSPRAENVDGWNTFGWGRKPHRYDPDLEWQDGDEEWSPYIDETKRVRIVGRKRHAEFQRQERAKQDKQDAEVAVIRRVEKAERREVVEVWREWVLKEVKLTTKQRALLIGEAKLGKVARSQMLSRIDARIRSKV